MSDCIHWGYDGEIGPNNWGDLSSEFIEAKIGKRQSPIDISKCIKADIKPIEFDYKEIELKVYNNGHGIMVNCEAGSSVIIDKERYDLIQFHFHTPAEHTVTRLDYPMELHFVHKNEFERIAVIGVLFNIGGENDNKDLQKIIDIMPKEIKEVKLSNEKINPMSFIPNIRKRYLYNGSLTTPPCSEDVLWNLFISTVEVSEDQIKAFQDLYKNNRPIQSNNNRFIIESI